jgi:hypothetical protein
LERADDFFVAPFDLLQLITDQVAPPLFQIAFKPHPRPLESISHGFLLMTIIGRERAEMWSELLRVKKSQPL